MEYKLSRIATSDWMNWRQMALALAVGLGVFLTASFCLSLPSADNGIVPLWLPNGISLAALLRTHQKRWPALIAASVFGIGWAALIHGATPIQATARSVSSVVQYAACAYVLRHRLGAYFDLTIIDHLKWLFGTGFVVIALQVIILTIISFTVHVNTISLNLMGQLSWFLTTFLGLFVFALPLLALTVERSQSETRLDRTSYAWLIFLALVVWLVFGPPAIVGAYLVLPPLMFLAWRNGLLGAGVGTLMSIILTLMFTYIGSGIGAMLHHAGYGIAARGLYLEMFFSASLLISLPLAVVRMQLTTALATAENRAAQLTESETSARQAEVRALQAAAVAVQARERLRQIIETSTDIICTVDAEGRFLEISENCASMWGWEREELLGKKSYDFIQAKDRNRTLRHYNLVKAGSALKIAHNHYVRPDGTRVPMSWSATWIESEQISHCIGRDMTEHKALEARAYGAQRMEALGHLTGGVAHDFNNLLTVVIGNSEILASEPDHPRRQRLAEMTLRAAGRGAELTEQLLAFARRQPLAPRAFDANELLAAAMPMIERALGEDLDLSIKKSDDLWKVHADPSRLEAAIMNLCLNARDAMPHGGKLVIETANATLTDDYVRRNPGAQAGEYVMIAVSDTGAGMAPEIMEKVFEPFFSTKEVGKGTGLGLSTVYGFIKQSQGHVSLTSEVGIGTIFRLYLPPANPIDDLIPKHDSVAKAMRYGRENILIVEDNDLVREQLQIQLESLGYSVTAAGNAPAALTILESRDDIDLLFTDVIMPGGMTGWDLGQITSERWPDIGILYTSGYAQDVLTKNGRLIEGLTLLQKPYSRQELSQKLRSVLDAIH